MYTNGSDERSYRNACKHYNSCLPRNAPENWPEGPWWKIETAPPQQPLLSDHKSFAQQHLVHIFNQLADDVAGLYPWFERDTWKDQEYEALTYKSWFNNGSNGAVPSTPTLTGISTARGITLPDLVARVIANANAWRQVAPQLAGQRQAYADQIEAAVDHAAVDSVLEFARAATVSPAA